jgi:AraC family transcriptional regulator, positive regulator of tynA and feaB
MMTTYLRANIGNPALSPALLARRMGVSPRTVHNPFRESGTTFGRWIIEHRLLACHKALTDPTFDQLAVSQIAFNFGFNDASHFTKAFRQRFDISPRDLRKARSASAADERQGSPAG